MIRAEYGVRSTGYGAETPTASVPPCTQHLAPASVASDRTPHSALRTGAIQL